MRAAVLMRRRAEEALRESENRYRAAAEAIDDAVHVKDIEERFVLVDSETVHLLTWAKADVLGKTIADVVDTPWAHQVMNWDTQVLRTGIAVDVDLECPDRHRATVCHAHEVPHRDEASRVIGVVTVSRDISGRKLAERKREKYLADLTRLRLRPTSCTAGRGVFSGKKKPLVAGQRRAG